MFYSCIQTNANLNIFRGHYANNMFKIFTFEVGIRQADEVIPADWQLTQLLQISNNQLLHD